MRSGGGGRGNGLGRGSLVATATLQINASFSAGADGVGSPAVAAPAWPPSPPPWGAAVNGSVTYSSVQRRRATRVLKTVEALDTCPSEQ